MKLLIDFGVIFLHFLNWDILDQLCTVFRPPPPIVIWETIQVTIIKLGANNLLALNISVSFHHLKHNQGIFHLAMAQNGWLRIKFFSFFSSLLSFTLSKIRNSKFCIRNQRVRKKTFEIKSLQFLGVNVLNNPDFASYKDDFSQLIGKPRSLFRIRVLQSVHIKIKTPVCI